MQLFGTDDNALIIIRTTATLSSLLILLVANFALKIDPPAMGFLTEAKTFSMLEEIRTNPANLLYFALGWTALALTLLTYLVGCHLKMYQLYSEDGYLLCESYKKATLLILQSIHGLFISMNIWLLRHDG
jgi:hypothetical protein